MDRVKKLLRVDSDDTEELHNKYRETSKDREEKIKLFEEQLNIMVNKILKILWFHISQTIISLHPIRMQVVAELNRNSC